jgi:Outer membrane protein beta-barrel domain
MRRITSLLCGALFLCASPSFAQGFGVGAKGGTNIATEEIKGDDGGPSLDWRVGGVAGAFVTLPLLPWVGLQAEGLYAMKGARLNFQGIESSIHLDYVEVPVLVRVRFAHRYYAAGGPSMAFAVRARTRTSFGGVTEEVDVMDQLKRFDFGVAMGGGVEFGKLVVDGRYTLGLTDIDKDKTDTSTTKNRAISVTAGFRF